MRTEADSGTEALQGKLRETEERLASAQELLRAIQQGEVDALVVSRNDQPVVYTLNSAGEPYRLLVEQMSEGALTVDRSGVILYCNDTFARMIGGRRERLIGTLLNDLILDPPNRTALTEVLAQSGRAGLEVEFRTESGTVPTLMSSSPVTVDGEAVYCIVVTNLSRQAMRLLHEAIIDASADAIFAVNVDGIIESWNGAAEELYGYSAQEAIGRSVRDMMPPDTIDLGWQRIQRVLTNGEKIKLDTCSTTKSGNRADVSVSLSPILETGGQIVGLAVIARDIAARKQAEKRVELLMREMNHRSKNLMAVVQAIAHLTSSQKDPVAFAEGFTKRMTALAKCHDLMVQGHWEGVELSELMVAQLSFCGDLLGTRIITAGPSICLVPAAAQPVALAIHELCTNAIKYGALSAPEGKVHISWGLVDSYVRLLWQEEGGPPVQEPQNRGFGSTLLERALSLDVGASSQLEFRPQGVRCTIQLPATALAQDRPEAG